MGRSRWPRPSATAAGSRRGATPFSTPWLALRARCRRLRSPRRSRPTRSGGAGVDGWLLPDTIDRLLALGRPERRGDVDPGSMRTKAECVAELRENLRGGVPAPVARKIRPARPMRSSSLYPATNDAEGGAVCRSTRRVIRASSRCGSGGVLRARTSRTPPYTYYWNHSMPGPDRDRNVRRVPRVGGAVRRSTACTGRIARGEAGRSRAIAGDDVVVVFGPTS